MAFQQVFDLIGALSLQPVNDRIIFNNMQQYDPLVIMFGCLKLSTCYNEDHVLTLQWAPKCKAP